MIELNIPKLDEVIAEANRKKITGYQIAKDTGMSTQTVYAYFKGERVSLRTQERIIEAINRQ
jgi:transcriptional regulator with XRE-family HTH domain